MTEPTAPATPATPGERKPWHAPTLTEVALTLTAQASGQTDDGSGSHTLL